MRRWLCVSTAAAALVLPAGAHAHVSVHPNVIPAGAFTEIVVRVPNERSDEETTRVHVRFPAGFVFVSYAPVPGWTTEVRYRELAQPVTAFGEQHDREVSDVIWSGGGIAAGQFVDFPLSVAMPERAEGTTLTFKALQTYSGGEVVRWIGGPADDNPAPQVTLAAGDAPIQDVPGGDGSHGDPGEAAGTEELGGGGGGGSTKENVALALGIAGLGTALVALAVALVRKRERP